MNKPKKTTLRNIGKFGKINLEVNKRLKELYEDSDIRSCELRLEGCENYPLNYCHRHERDWYKQFKDVEKIIEMMSSKEQTVIGCQWCHHIIDTDKKLREEKFNQLR